MCRSFERGSDVTSTGASNQFSFSRRSCIPSRRSARVYCFILPQAFSSLPIIALFDGKSNSCTLGGSKISGRSVRGRRIGVTDDGRVPQERAHAARGDCPMRFREESIARPMKRRRIFDKDSRVCVQCLPVLCLFQGSKIQETPHGRNRAGHQGDPAVFWRAETKLPAGRGRLLMIPQFLAYP